MNTTLVIAGRELREKSRIVLICGFLAVLPFVTAALPFNRGHRATMIPIIGGFLSVAMALGLAVVLGATTVMTDLVQRRGSFYFSKPVSASALWLGKAGASILISFAAFVIVAVPSALLGQRGPSWEWVDDRVVVAGVALAIVGLFLVSHTVASMVRSRSPLLGIDFVLLLASLGALVSMARPLLVGGAMETAGWLGLALGVAFLLVAAAAPIWQLEYGRADIRRSHAALSRALWPAVAALLLAAGAYVFWFVRVTPSSLDSIIDIVQPYSGDRMFLSGQARSDEITATFLIDGNRGDYRRLPAPGWWGVELSRDGRVAAWLNPSGMTFWIWGHVEFELHVLRLDRPDAGPTATGIVTNGFSSIALSDDGSRVALVTGERVAVHDTGSGRLVASARIAGLGRHDAGRGLAAVYFATPDLLRVVDVETARRMPTVQLRVHEIDVARRSMQQTGGAGVASGMRSVAVSDDGSRMILRGTTRILDARTAATQHEVAASPVNLFALAFLQGGSVAAIDSEGEGLVFRLFDSGGAPVRAVPLTGSWTGASVLAEISDGRVLINARRVARGETSGLATLVVDPAAGTVTPAPAGIVIRRHPWETRLARFAAGQWLAGMEPGPRLVLWNPATGERKPLPM